MPEIIFLYNGNSTTIICKEKDILKEVFNKFIIKNNVQSKRIIYHFNGKIADENKTVDQMTKEKSLTINAYDEDNSPPQKINNIIQSNEVICPKCKCKAFLTIKDYKFNLNCSKNDHILNNILIKDFLKTQEIDNGKIICFNCKNKSRRNIYNFNFFYRCYTCGEDICHNCKFQHNNAHIIIKYDERNYICNIHNEIYSSYCKTCKANICLKCGNAHIKHEMINYGDILIKVNELQNDMKDIRKQIDIFKEKTNEKTKSDIIIENLEEYYKIIKKINDNYIKNSKRNYENIKNIKEIIDNNKIIINDIKKINNYNKYTDIIDIYNKINNINYNYSKIIYKINKNNDNIRILGKEFIKNNKDKIKLEIEGKEYELMENYKINDNNIIEIKIKEIENVTNFSYMFCGCSSLEYLDLSFFDTQNVTNFSYMFCGCSSLTNINLSFFNTINATNMSCMFSWCSSLSHISDISIWNTNNVTNMNSMFCGCSSLLQLPDISNWNINNVYKFE